MGKHITAAAFALAFAFAFAFGIGINVFAVGDGSSSRSREKEEIGAEACIDINVNITLSLGLYGERCPEAEAIVFSWVERAVADDPRMAASLLRLHFHDCIVNGCDASVLLDDTASMEGEKSAAPNANSLRGFQVIDAIKQEVEYFCPQTVSCADILAIAARDSVFLCGGPRWEVELGRRDSMSLMGSKAKAAANNNIPGPNSDLPTLLSKFNNVGLSLKDLIALSGAHTIGKARCSTFTTTTTQQQQLPMCAGAAADNNTAVADLDYVSPTRFDNQYYVNLVSGEGLLPSDQALLSDASARALVDSYADDVHLFFRDFVQSMLAMAALPSPSPSPSQIRTNCHFVN